jgi:hypothetical protein
MTHEKTKDEKNLEEMIFFKGTLEELNAQDPSKQYLTIPPSNGMPLTKSGTHPYFPDWNIIEENGKKRRTYDFDVCSKGGFSQAVVRKYYLSLPKAENEAGLVEIEYHVHRPVVYRRLHLVISGIPVGRIN